ncbi:hypothetical protein FEM48_Zijuj12G0028500 [Ziziphus jujuba var. spinosa]|uniref:Transcriptional corepressor LEUNIG-like n=1 Tax=Ziziphus jujuba var. spinosa TaxID=714518 RepID=A0A978UAS5_ZIZJJ|nr:hypothetical protein FEM48_Zijuj12G0028500 [Ziziphus jujuba var. spinosa]
MKRKLHASAKAFQSEGKVSTDPVAIDAPGGFLFEWWSVFWDIFIARTNEKHSEAAASYIETQLNKTREQQQQQQQQQKPQQNHPMQMQKLLLQRHVLQQQQQQQQQQQHQQQQQQQRDGTQLLNGTSNGLVSSEPLMRQNPATANALATKMYEEKLKLPLQRDALDDAALKQRLGDNMGQLLDPNHASLLKVAAAGGQPPGYSLEDPMQMLHGTPGGIPGGISGNPQQAQNRNQQLPGSTQEIKSEMMSPKVAGPEGSLIGIHGSNQGGNNLTLKGWPLTGFDRLRSGLLQQPNSLIQSSQPLSQLQLQQQLMLQAQQNLASPSANDLECRRLRMLLSNRNMTLGKDGQLHSVGDVSNVGSPVQVGCPVLPHENADMLIKHPLSSQHSLGSNHHLQQQDKLIGAGNSTADGSISNTFQGNDQASKNQIGRKRKQPVSSSGPANSSGTANTTGPSPSSPSTPSIHTGDAMSMPTLPNKGGSSKSLLMFGSDGLGSLTSAPNQLAEMDRFVDDGSLDDNVDSFLSHDDADPRDRVNHCSDVTKGFTFSEVRVIPASTGKVECCNFSRDGKLLATGGHDRKAFLWCTESFVAKYTLDEHSQWITDIIFSPSMSRLATSSADKTVRVWDVDNPGYSLRTFTGHSTSVTSLDFHPNKEDLICSCDNNSEIRYWSIKNGSCAGVFKGGATQMRFQPCHGRTLAAAADNFVSILDVETQVCRVKLQGHKNLVHSVCWDSSGELVASVSDDMYLELWNMKENKSMNLRAHDKLVSSLAVSSVTGLVASASHDKCVKIWK